MNLQVFLTRVLLQSGQLQSGTVADFDCEKLDGGYTSTVYRLLLSYGSPLGLAPESAVIKFHSNSRSIRETFQNFNIYEKEVRFYERIAEEIDLRIPKCYYTAIDPKTQKSILLLEDLTYAQPGDQAAGCSAKEAKQVFPHLARLHATYWESPRLRAMTELEITP